ncbi:MAG: Synechococcus phage [Bacteroidota bacterium]
MNYAIINSENIVENIVLAEPDFAVEQGWKAIPEDQPVEIGWVYNGQNFIDSTTEEEEQILGWKIVRFKRDKLLKETDVFMLVDRFNSLTLEEQNSVTEYRRDLRDIPQNYLNYSEVVWPKEPDFLLSVIVS